MSRETLLHRLRTALAPRYAVESEIAAGGMGIVYAARDTRLGRPVAIKVLQPGRATATAAERFVREARTLARLRHPNVLSVHDADEADGLHYFVMDLFDGPTLAERLQQGPLTPRELRRLARGLLAGLAAAHDLGIVHRDIKPSNIFFHEGQVSIADFGIASTTEVAPDDQLTEEGQRIGTPKYMPPEQFAGLPVTAQADIYAAGLVLYEAATGRAWPGVSDPRRADWTGVPLHFRRPLRRSLAAEPERRWRDARQFALRLAPPRRQTLLAVGALAPILAALAGWFVSRDPGADGGGPSADLAVLPFSGPDSVLASDLSSFTAANLGWSPRWSFRPLADAREHGPRARTWVEGSLHAAGDSHVVVITVHDSSGPAKRMRVPGHRDRLVEWAAAVSDSVVAASFPRRLHEFRDLMAASRGDFTANRLLIGGVDAFAADDWERADSLLRAAIARDPSLFRAVWEHDLLQKWWRRESSEADRLRLREVMDSLPKPYGSLLRLELEPDLRRRLAGYAALVDSYPDNSRARFLLLNEAFHRGPLSGMPLDSALRLIAAGIGSDPYLQQVAMYDHLLWGALHLGDRATADSARGARAALVRRLGRHDELGGLFDLVYRSRFQPAAGWLATKAAAWKFRNDPEGLTDYLRLGLTFDAPELQEQLGRAVSRARDPSARATGHMARGLALLQLGRGRDGMAHLDTATAQLGTVDARLHLHALSVLADALGFPVADPARLTHAAAVLDTLASGTDAVAAQAAWTLAAAALVRGDTMAGAAWEARFASRPATPGTAYLAGILGALELAAHGRLDAAVPATDTLNADDRSGSLGGPFARAVLYLERGRWLHELGRADEAEATWLFHENSYLRGWPTGEMQSGEIDAVLSGLAKLYRAELAMEAGRHEHGCRLVRRTRSLWKRADPAFAPLVARAGRVAAAC
jgi:serine/threonine protein kinase